MLTEEQIIENKGIYIDLMHELDERFGKDSIDGLIAMLEDTDFFTAPAATYYHCAYKGGLCQHSLNVYSNLTNLISMKNESRYSKETLILVSLLHDISKVNSFEEYAKNVKHYSDNGSKRDEFGRFDWVAEKAYRYKDFRERFVLSTHEMNSYYIISQFLTLSVEEASAVLNHMGSFDKPDGYEYTQILNVYPLACYLHIADLLSSSIDEGIDE